MIIFLSLLDLTTNESENATQEAKNQFREQKEIMQRVIANKPRTRRRILISNLIIT